MTFKVLEFTKPFGVFEAGRKLKEDIHGDYIVSVSDEEFLADAIPWMGAIRFKKAYVESLPPDLLREVGNGSSNQPVKIIAQIELSDGTLAVVEDALNKDVYHVYKNGKNIQPNHDAFGVMRYLAVVLHSLDYKANNLSVHLANARNQITTLENKVAVLEEFLTNFTTDGHDVKLATRAGDHHILFTSNGHTLYRHGTSSIFTPVKDVREALNLIYTKEQE